MLSPRTRTEMPDTGFAGRLGDLDAGSFSLQGLGRRNDAPLLDRLFINNRYSRGQIFLLLRTVTDDHHFIQMVVSSCKTTSMVVWLVILFPVK